MKERLTRIEWELIAEALGFILAGEIEAETVEESDAKREALEETQRKVRQRTKEN